MASSSFFFQLNEGEQLYASSLPGNCAWIASRSARFLQVRFRGLAPDQVAIRRIGQAARDGRVETAVDGVEALRGALAGAENAIVRIDVARQKMRAVGIGAGQDQRGNIQNVRRQPGCDEFLYGFLRGHQNFAAQVSALLRRRQLVFKVNAGRARFDHRLHQLKSVQRAAEAGFGVGDQRSEPVNSVLAFRMMNLVGAREGVVQAAAEVRERSRQGKDSDRDTSGRHCWRRPRLASR